MITKSFAAFFSLPGSWQVLNLFLTLTGVIEAHGILKFFTRKTDIWSRVTVMVGQYFLGVEVQP
jgi:hypothetical protein